MSNSLKESISLEEEPIKGPMRDEELSSLLKASQEKNFTLDSKLNPKEGDFLSRSLLDIAMEAEKKREAIEKEKANDSIKKTEVDGSIDEKKVSSNFRDDAVNKSQDIEGGSKKESNLDETKKDSLESTPTLDGDNQENSIKKEDQEEINTVSYDQHKSELDSAYNKGLEEGKLLGISESRKQLSDGVEVATAALRQIIDSLKNKDHDILKDIKNTLFERVKEISGELAGRVIHSLPKDYANRLSNLADILANKIDHLTIYVNPQDLDAIQKSEEASKVLADINLKTDETLLRGDAKIKVEGIEIQDISENRLKSRFKESQGNLIAESELENANLDENLISEDPEKGKNVNFSEDQQLEAETSATHQEIIKIDNKNLPDNSDSKQGESIINEAEDKESQKADTGDNQDLPEKLDPKQDESITNEPEDKESQTADTVDNKKEGLAIKNKDEENIK